jgi:hypothetical protein
MTYATKSWKLGCAGILVSFSVGCGSSGDASQDTPVAPPELNAAGFIPVTETADDPGYCGYLDFGSDEDGNRIVSEERYYYPVINRRLGEDPELQSYTGLTEVSTCDEARHFIEASNRYSEERPRSTADDASVFANFPRMPAEAPKRDPSGRIEKIYRGTEDAIEEVIGYGYVLQGKVQNCTGTRLGGALYLTAAHCLSINSRPAGAMPTVSFKNAWMKHVNKLDDTDGDGDVDNDDDGNPYGELYTTVPSRCKNLKPNQNCAALEIDGIMHPNYAGTLDYQNDVAVLHVKNNSQSGLRTVKEAAKEFSTDVGFISTVSPQVADPVETAGWGPNGNNDSNLSADQYALRAAATRPIAAVGPTPTFVGGMYTGSHISTIAAANAQLCRGDSGGPSYDEFRHVIGVTSRASAFDTVHKSCAQVGATQYMSRVDYHVLLFVPLAMWNLQRGDETHPCTCAFFPSSSDPTGMDREAPGAHIRCNIGCGDPTQWTP